MKKESGKDNKLKSGLEFIDLEKQAKEKPEKRKEPSDNRMREISRKLAEDEPAGPEISMETLEFIPLDIPVREESRGKGNAGEGAKKSAARKSGAADKGTARAKSGAGVKASNTKTGGVKKSSSTKKRSTSNKRNSHNRGSGKNQAPALEFLAALWHKIVSMSMMDRIVATTGAVVMIIAMVTCTVYASAKSVEAQVASFSEVSDKLEGLGVAGESGLLAVANARVSQVDIPETEEAQETETESGEETENSIGFNMNSVEKDLKIKFVNSSTNRLMSGIPFEVEVSGPDGKTQTWTDDDKDGVIYKKDLTPGGYKVSLKDIEALKGYTYYKGTQSVTVKDKIEYKKIEVIDEIKSEAEVNVAAEDTAQKEQDTTPALKDTVEWVESTKTPINGEGGEGDGVYEERDKSKITDPMTTARAGGFSKFVSENDPTEVPGESTAPSNPPTEEPSKEPSQEPSVPPEDNSVKTVKINGDTASVNVNQEITLKASAYNGSNKEVSASFTWSSSDYSVATVSSGGVVKGQKEGSARITASAGGVTSGACTVTVKNDLSVSLSDVTLAVGENKKIDPSISASGSYDTPRWENQNADIIDMKQDGNSVTVTGKKTGTATLKVTITSAGKTVSATCKVTVNASDIGLKLDKTTVTLLNVKDRNTATLNAGVNNDVNGDKYEWSSDNTKVVTVTNNNSKQATITAAGAGTANITVKLTRGSETSTVSCKVVVKEANTKLKDNDGNQIYIKNKDGKYVEAVFSDYYTASKFYILSKNVEYKYTGWQTIDGKTYFYTKDGKRVTGEQIIQGVKYNFDSDGAMVSGSGVMGIDVSRHNGSIDWNAVKNAGVSYVIIRCGYRGSSTGALIADQKFKSNIQGATAAGLKVGVYVYSQAVNEVEAVEEASMALSLIKGYKISYPVFIDIEGSGGRGDRIDRGTRTKVAQAFCQTVKNGGYTPGIYANKNWFETKMNTASLTGYKLWLAQYAAKPTYTATRYDMWQYTSKGRVNGIKGNVDMNISYLGY